MRVRLTTGLSGSQFCLGAGDEHEFPRDEALRLIAAGIAVPVVKRKMERAIAIVPALEQRGDDTASHGGDGNRKED